MFLPCTQLANILYLIYDQMAFILTSKLYFLFYLFTCMHTHRSAYHGARARAGNTLQENSSLLCGSCVLISGHQLCLAKTGSHKKVQTGEMAQQVKALTAHAW